MQRKILILGGSSTLGAATGQLLRSQGADVWLTYARAPKEAALRQVFPDNPLSQVNVFELDQVRQLCNQVKAKWGGLDGLVCAFGEVLLQPLNRTNDESLHRILSLNLLAVMRICREFFPVLLKGNQSAVVLFCSSMGLVGAPAMSVYAASKGGVASFTQSLAVEWAPRRIRVNAVAPGLVPSPSVADMFAHLTPEQVESIHQRHPLGLGEPVDVANAVSFLLSPAARWITGVVLPVDGGYTAQ